MRILRVFMMKSIWKAIAKADGVKVGKASDRAKKIREIREKGKERKDGYGSSDARD